MQDFPGNSTQKAKDRSDVPSPEERPKIERITSAVPERKKRGLGRKFKETFISGSARDTVEYVITDTIVPGIRDMVFDAFEGGLQRLIYGESSRTRRPAASSAYSSLPRVNYQSMSKAPPAYPEPRALSRRSRSRHDFGEIIIESRAEASEVVDTMYEILSRHGDVKISDLYDMTGIETSHVDHKWGWTALPGAKYVRTRDGRFALDLPEPVLLS